MDFYLVISTQTAQINPSNITLQLSDDPLLKPDIGTLTVGYTYINVPYNANPDGYNPQVTGLRIRKRVLGGTWGDPETYAQQSGTISFTGLKQGKTYEFEAWGYTALTPTDRTSPTVSFQGTTDFLVTIQLVRDTEGNPTEGAVVVALPQQDVIELVPSSDYGTDLPVSQFGYARVNKTNSQGACNIRIPGGHGEVYLIVVPPSSTLSGATAADLDTEEP